MNIEIPDSLFRRLQKFATPLVDTNVTVLERLVDFYEQHNRLSRLPVEPAVRVHENAPRRQIDPKRPPSLLHTRVRGNFGGTSFSTWNDLVRVAHSAAMPRAGSFEDLRKATLAHIRKGRYEEEGYRYLPEVDISIQGVDANRAWEHGLRLAIYLGVPLGVEVEWRNNDKAAFPGERQSMSWPPALHEFQSNGG